MALKEYLYLDTKYLNSSLAQLGQGLTTSQHNGTEKAEENGDSKTNEVNGGVSNFLHLGITLEKKATEEADHKIGNSTQEVIDSVLDDYAVQILQEHLNDETVEIPLNANEGDFVNFSSPFKIYDFNFLSKILSSDNMDLIKRQDPTEKRLTQIEKNISALKSSKKGNNKQNNGLIDDKINVLKSERKRLQTEITPGSWDSIEPVADIAAFFNNTLPDSIVIRMENAILYCDRNLFRENATQLSMLATSKRKMTVFGSVMSITRARKDSDPTKEFEANELNAIPELFSNVMLSSFNMLDDDKTIIVRPIAISFD